MLTPRRRDHDHHDKLGLEDEHLDVVDLGRLQGRGRHEREQVRQLGECLRRRQQGRIDLAAGVGEIEQELSGLRLEALEELIDIEAVTDLGWDAPRRGVRMHEEPSLLEDGELVPNRGGRRLDARALHQLLGADRGSGRHVFLDDAREDLLLARRKTGARVERHRGLKSSYFQGFFHQLDRDGTAQEASAAGQGETTRAPLDETKPLEPRKGFFVYGPGHVREGQARRGGARA